MAATTMGKLVMVLSSNDSEFRTGMKKTLAHAQRSMKRASAQFGRIGRQMSMSLTAPLVLMGAASVKAFAVQEKAEKKLHAALKASGQEADKNLARFKKQAAAIQNVTTVGDEMSISLAATAVAMGIQADQLDAVVKGAVGLSKAFEMDLNTAIKAASAALQGKTELLTRYIPTLSQVEGEANKVAFVMDKMAQGFAVAKAEAETTEGKLLQMKNRLGDVMEMIGARLAPAITRFAEKLESVFKVLNAVNPALVDMAVQMGIMLALAGPLTLGLSGILSVLSAIAGVSLVSLGTALAGIVIVVGGFVAVMEDANLEIEKTSTSASLAGEVIGNVFGVVANVIHGIRIAFNVMTLGILQGIKWIADAWTGLGNGMQDLWWGITSLIKIAMHGLINFIRTKVFPLVNEAQRQASKVAAFLNIGEPGQGFDPLPTNKLKFTPTDRPEKQTNNFAAALEEELTLRGDRIAELWANWPAEKIKKQLAELGTSLDENLDPDKVQPATDAANGLSTALEGVESVTDAVGKASGKMGDDIEENAGRAVRAYEGVKAAMEDIPLGIDDAAKSTETLREATERYANSFSDRMAGFLTGASNQFKSFGDVAKSVLRDIANDLVRSGIRSLLGSLFGTGGVVASLFGGGRAAGGPVDSGTSYLVGERGPELFVPDGAGSIVPNSRLSSTGGGGEGTAITVVQNFESGIDEGRLAQVARQIKEDTTDGILAAIQRGGGFRAAVQA